MRGVIRTPCCSPTKLFVGKCSSGGRGFRPEAGGSRPDTPAAHYGVSGCVLACHAVVLPEPRTGRGDSPTTLDPAYFDECAWRCTSTQVLPASLKPRKICCVPCRESRSLNSK